MRIIFRVFATLSIISVIFLLCITIVLWASLQPDQTKFTLATLNWSFLIPSLLISGFTLLVGAVGVFVCGTNEGIWKSQEELFELREQLRKERMEVFEIRDKLTRALIKHE